MRKLPAIQFYTGDWRKDPAVQSLDHFQKGVWIDVLCLMNESPRRGYLILPSGAPMPDDAIARNLGLEVDRWREVKSALLLLGVASENDVGALYNRRIVRDEKLRAQKARAGKKGGAASGRSRRSSARDKKEVPEAETKQELSKGEAEGQAKKGSSVAVAVSSSASAEGVGRTPPTTGVEGPPSPFAKLLPGFDAAVAVLDGWKHGGGVQQTVRSLASRFLYPDGQEPPIAEPRLAGRTLEQRRLMVAVSVLELAERGNDSYSSRGLAAFLRDPGSAIKSVAPKAKRRVASDGTVLSA